jgi:hypothetical protein
MNGAPISGNAGPWKLLENEKSRGLGFVNLTFINYGNEGFYNDEK